jgi:hypothetical protein
MILLIAPAPGLLKTKEANMERNQTARSSKEYNAIRHLARAVFPGRWRTAQIAMFAAYFDASCTDGDPVVTLAGFVSTEEKWEKFCREWAEILSANPKVSMFHMTDYASSQEGWEDWPKGDRRRPKLERNLVRCIRRNTNKGFAVSIEKRHYDWINARYTFRQSVGNRYAACGVGCAGQLRHWADKKGADYRDVLCLFEDGDAGQGKLIQILRSEGFNADLQSKRHLRMFDACDLAAWKIRRAIDDTFVRHLPRESADESARIMRSLGEIEKVVQDDGMLDDEALKKICLRLSIPRRPAPQAKSSAMSQI